MAASWIASGSTADWIVGGREGDMPEEIKAEAAEADAKQPTGRVWTDEEHDAYVKARIDKQAARFAESKAALDARIAELEAAQKERDERLAAYEAAEKRSQLVDEVAKEVGLPVSVVSALKGDDADALKASAEAIKGSIKLYPQAPAGANPGPVRTPQMNIRDIADIRDHRERLAAIEANMDLYK